MSRKFTADFETTTDINDCRVWAYGLCEIGNPNNFHCGNNLDEFFKILQYKRENFILYFHNLKFDGEFIFNWLLNNGYECIKDKKDRKDKTFTTLISDMGQFYSIEIYFEVKGKKKTPNKVTIYDSLKILNFSVEKIAKDFDLPVQKLELDYNKYREVGHIITEEEKNYIKNDVEIMARALDVMFNRGLNKMTIGSDALHSYKSINKNFKKYFPVLHYEIDKDIRRSYKGGFTYLNDIYKEQELGCGLVFDKNSMYPAKMKFEKMPFGEPLYFIGEYQKDFLYPLYIQTISCSFEIKKGCIPSIQIKNNLSFVPNEYIKSSNGDIVTLTLTNVDLDLFFEQYDVFDLTFHSGWKFRAIKGLFTEYIDFWTNEKINAKKENNSSMYLISKLMLNSLYGKFGLNPNVRGKYPYLSEDGSVRYKLYDKDVRDAIYLPVASFITSYARADIIRSSQKIRDYSIEKYGIDKYVYSDTDSIHCLLEEDDFKNDILDIDDYRLGAWKLENKFTRAKFIRQKCYIEEYDGKINTTIAGMPKKLGKYITFENFNKGFSILKDDDVEDKKLTFKHTKGGVILVNTDFTIK